MDADSVRGVRHPTQDQQKQAEALKRFELPEDEYRELCNRVIVRDGHRCRRCKKRSNLVVHHICFRSQGGGDYSHNLVTLCDTDCHKKVHDLHETIKIVILGRNGGEPDADVGLRFQIINRKRRD